jgi:hypothetical protein
MPPPPSQPAPATVFGISVDWLADMQSWLDAVFGSSAELITWWQMSLRAVVILIYGILIFASPIDACSVRARSSTSSPSF